MTNRTLLLTETDHRVLSDLVEEARRSRFEDPIYVEELASELEKATVVPPDEIPADVVTLHSRVKLEFPQTRGTTTVQIVPPMELNLAAGRISVLSPLGTALIGCRAGDEVEYAVRGVIRRAGILSVQYQPEASEMRRTLKARNRN